MDLKLKNLNNTEEIHVSDLDSEDNAPEMQCKVEVDEEQEVSIGKRRAVEIRSKYQFIVFANRTAHILENSSITQNKKSFNQSRLIISTF